MNISTLPITLNYAIFILKLSIYTRRLFRFSFIFIFKFLIVFFYLKWNFHFYKKYKLSLVIKYFIIHSSKDINPYLN